MRFIDSERAFREMLEADPLRGYYTDWTRVGPPDVEAFSAALETATDERALQRFLGETHGCSFSISAAVTDGGSSRISDSVPSTKPTS